ncbi:MAG: tetratricopeptide repeat protein [Meiothermus sp.]|nr:tetratricopeptide repeat protein [Meiothermus sp.]
MALGLWGEAGVGKTHTAQTLLRQTPCLNFSLHATTPPERWPALLPRPKTLELWAERILEQMAGGQAVANQVEALGALLARLTPVVVHLEDVHEAQPEQVGFILKLAEIARRSKGVGLLLTSRGELPAPIEATRLEPLSPTDSRDLLHRHAGAELPAEATEWIFGKAAGNPLFTLEYLRHLSRMGNLWNDGQRWNWRAPQGQSMPLTVEALLEQILSQVITDPALGPVLFSKALLPKEVGPVLVGQMAQIGHDKAIEAQRELRRRGILVGESFAHPLFREVTLQTLPVRERQALSRRALDLFAEDAVQAAAYAEDAGLPPEQTFALLRQAAEATHSDSQAGRFLLRALEYVNPAERQAFTLKVAQTIRDTHTETAIGLLERNLRDHPEDTEAIYTLSNLLARGFRRKEAEVVFARLPIEEQQSQRGRVAWLETLAYLQENAETIQLWREQFAQDTSDPRVVGAVANAMSRLAQFAEAIQLCQQALQQPELEPWERIRLTNTLGMIYNDSNAHALAEQAFSQVIRLMAQYNMAQRKFVPLYNRALARKWMGRFGEASADAEESRKLAAEAGQPHSLAQSLSVLGELTLEQGRYQEAEDLLHQAEAIYAQSSASNHTVDVYNNLITLYLEWHTPHSGLLALKYARKAVETARILDNPTWLFAASTSAVMVEVVFGSLPKALDWLEGEQPLLEQRNTPYERYLLDWAKAKAALQQGRPEQALALLQQAQATAAQIHHVLDFNKLGLEIARLLGDLGSARTYLGWFEQNGLGNGINLAHRLFPELTGSGPSTPVMKGAESIRLEVLGPLHVIQNGEAKAVRGRKRQELLALLLEARLSGRGEVSRLSLLEALY